MKWKKNNFKWKLFFIPLSGRWWKARDEWVNAKENKIKVKKENPTKL